LPLFGNPTFTLGSTSKKFYQSFDPADNISQIQYPYIVSMNPVKKPQLTGLFSHMRKFNVNLTRNLQNTTPTNALDKRRKKSS